jgi:MerR family transcriptional regulator/heat shock protein HspR
MSLIYYRVEVVRELLDLTPAQLRRYLHAGLIAASAEPERPGGPRRFTEEDVRRARRVRRLERDLGLNQAGLEVVMRLVDQIEALQRQLAGR